MTMPRCQVQWHFTPKIPNWVPLTVIVCQYNGTVLQSDICSTIAAKAPNDLAPKLPSGENEEKEKSIN